MEEDRLVLSTREWREMEIPWPKVTDPGVLHSIQADMPDVFRVLVEADGGLSSGVRETSMTRLASALPGNTHLKRIRVTTGRSVPKAFLAALPQSCVMEVDFTSSLVPISVRRQVVEKVGAKLKNAWSATQLRLSWAKTAHPRLAAESALVAELPLELIALVGVRIEERYVALFAHLSERQRLFNYTLRQQTLARRRARLASMILATSSLYTFWRLFLDLGFGWSKPSVMNQCSNSDRP